MVIELKKSTYLSLLLLFLVIIIYFLHYFINVNYYRRVLSIITLFIFYPSFLLSIYFSINSFRMIYCRREKKDKTKWIVLNSLSLIFGLYFIVNAILVLSKSVVQLICQFFLVIYFIAQAFACAYKENQKKPL